MKCGWCRCTMRPDHIKRRLIDFEFVHVHLHCNQPIDSRITAGEFLFLLRGALRLDSREPTYAGKQNPDSDQAGPG